MKRKEFTCNASGLECTRTLTLQKKVHGSIDQEDRIRAVPDRTYEIEQHKAVINWRQRELEMLLQKIGTAQLVRRPLDRVCL